MNSHTITNTLLRLQNSVALHHVNTKGSPYKITNTLYNPENTKKECCIASCKQNTYECQFKHKQDVKSSKINPNKWNCTF